jgi:hypothetical protein
MNAPHPSELEEIQRLDEQVGEDSALQMWPAVYTHRRQLLAHITALNEAQAADDAALTELFKLLEPFSAGAVTLQGLVENLRKAHESHAAVQVQPEPPRLLSCTAGGAVHTRFKHEDGSFSYCLACGAPPDNIIAGVHS